MVMKNCYTYLFRNTPGDYWRLYMSQFIRSKLGLIHGMLTAAFFAAAVIFWKNSILPIRILLVLAVILPLLYQMLRFFAKAIQESEKIRVNTKAVIDQTGLHIYVGERCQDHAWNEIWKCMERPSFILIMPDRKHGYLLTNRILKGEKKELSRLIRAHMSMVDAYE